MGSHILAGCTLPAPPAWWLGMEVVPPKRHLHAKGLLKLISPLLISARENFSGCRRPRQSHQPGRHDYQSRSILQMGKGEQLTPPGPVPPKAEVALSSPLRLHITSCQMDEKYRICCDSLTSAFITLLKKHKSPPLPTCP